MLTYLENAVSTLLTMMCAHRLPFHVAFFATVQPSRVDTFGNLDVGWYLARITKVGAQMSNQRHYYIEVERDEMHDAPHAQRQALNDLLIEFALVEPIEYVESVCGPTSKVD